MSAPNRVLESTREPLVSDRFLLNRCASLLMLFTRLSLSKTSNPATVDLMTPRTRIRLALDKLEVRSSEHDEIKKVYRDVHITIVLPDQETKITKEVSVGETVGNVKFAICEGAELDYEKIRLFLQPKHEPMLELLSLNDFKYISEDQGEIIIKAEKLE